MFASRAEWATHESVRVWDLPTRLFHWALVVVVSGAWITTFWEWMLPLHLWFGRALILLLGFRWVWGWIGNGFVRFQQFVASPGQVRDYLQERRKGPVLELGHNPPASWMMLLMLLVLSALALTGWLVQSGLEQIGPWAGQVSLEQGSWAWEVHQQLAYGLLVLVSGHVVAALFESWAQRQNLPWAMVTGWKREVPEANRQEREIPGNRRHQTGFLLLLLIAGVGLAWIPMDFHNPLTQAALREETSPEQQLYLEECAACHVGFHPSLLPQRSWQALMAGLEDHFGEDASLDEETTQALEQYLVARAAEVQPTEAAFLILGSIPPEDVPLRITEAAFWKHRHANLEQSLYERSLIGSPLNCNACHQYAEYGSFEDAHIQIPGP